MTKKTAAINASPLSASGVAVMLQGTGIAVHPSTEKNRRANEVKQIAQVLQSELGPNAPARMVQESAKSYYKVFCAVSASQDRPPKAKPCKG